MYNIAIKAFVIRNPSTKEIIIGPLIEVPVLISLVNVALIFQKHYFTKPQFKGTN